MGKYLYNLFLQSPFIDSITYTKCSSLDANFVFLGENSPPITMYQVNAEKSLIRNMSPWSSLCWAKSKAHKWLSDGLIGNISCLSNSAYKIKIHFNTFMYLHQKKYYSNQWWQTNSSWKKQYDTCHHCTIVYSNTFIPSSFEAIRSFKSR